MYTKNIIFLITFLIFFVCVTMSAESGQKRLKLISVDEKTETRFSVIEVIGGMPGSDPCRYGGFGGLDVVGEVPSNVELADDTIAKSLIKKGKEAALKACPSFNLSNGELRIKLFIDEYNIGQKKESEVFAMWKQVYRRFHDEAISKGPTEYHNEALKVFKKQSLAKECAKAGIDASIIAVKSIHRLDVNSSYPRYSPDGSKILYSKQMYPKRNQAGKPFQIQVIKDIKTLKTIKTFGKDGTSRKGAWSPDSKKIAYFAMSERGMGLTSVKGKLHIFDLVAEKTYNLDYPEFAYGGDFIVWEDEQKLYVINTYYRNGTSLNLDTLEKSSLSEKIYSRFLKSQVKSWWTDNSEHKCSYIYRQDVKRGEPSLIVANKYNSYGHVLIEGVYDQHPYIISPDFTSVVYDQGGDLYIAYLGKREKPITTFMIQFLDSELKERLNAALKNDVTIWGTVFGPRFNPLNNKLVGPDKKVFKGYVMFKESDGSHFIVTTTFEKESFGKGDIVSEIYPEDRNIRRNVDIWTVLEKVE